MERTGVILPIYFPWGIYLGQVPGSLDRCEAVNGGERGDSLG